jgi:hypothetical protein
MFTQTYAFVKQRIISEYVLTFSTDAYHTVRMNTIQPIDVRKLLTDLWEKGGLSDEKIGKQVSTPGPTINRLRTGIHKTTDANRAIRIANFHAQTFSEGK